MEETKEITENPAIQVQEPKKIGRPSDYTQELADVICERIALGESMRSVCRDEEMPAMSSAFKWLREFPLFTEQYERATNERTEAQQEDLLEMGDKAIEHAEDADPKAAGAVVSAYKLKADNLKWSMSKMKPKKYGDKIDMTTNGKDIPTPILNLNQLKDVPGDNSDQKDSKPIEKN